MKIAARQHKMALTAMMLVMGLGLAPQARAQTAGGSAQKSDDSDKVDLKKLEEKYWAAKDSDYAVVQNRTYTKATRPYLSLSYGPLINDSYSIGRMSNLALGYFFSERWGFEFSYEKGDLKDNDGVTKYRDQYGVQVDYNKFISSKSVQAIFVPLYAKMSFLDKSILYFDIQFALGLGQIEYEVQRNIGATTLNTTSFNFDVTQQLFFHEHWALRLDIKNKWSSQERHRYQLSGTQTEADRKLSNIQNQDTTLLLGVTFFY